MTNADEFVVQTPTMKRLLEARTQGRVPVRVLPFMTESSGYARNVAQATAAKRESYEFLYVASGEPHKNHRRTIEAWCLLAEEGLFPSLRLTLDETRFSTLYREIEEKRQGCSGCCTGRIAPAKSGGSARSNFESFNAALI